MATVELEVRRRTAVPRQPIEHWTDEPRADAWDKVTGHAVYVEDVPDLPGILYAATLRSPYSHAKIVSIDSSRAESLPGVVGVLDREYLGGLSPIIPDSPHNPIARRTASDDPTAGDEPFIATDRDSYDGDV